jgi:hypothetical protein
MLPRENLQNMKPLFATPAYGGTVTVNYTQALMELGHAFFSESLPFALDLRTGDSLITRARNDAVAGFLSDESLTHLFWIDADIGFQPDQVFRILLADHGVCAGLYPLKSYNWPERLGAETTNRDLVARYLRYPVNFDFANVDADGFMEVREAPTGFMCIQRAVFIAMIEAFPDLRYTKDDYPPSPKSEFYYRFFDTMVDPINNRYLSEDYAFCQRWRSIGGKVHVDTESSLSHQGAHVYVGDFRASEHFMSRGRS